MCRIQPIKKKSICPAAKKYKYEKEVSSIASLSLNNRDSMTTNLFVAIAIPLRSLIKPTSANLTASVRNTASGVDSKLRKT